MAADSANQKVFVPLKGVLSVQDQLRRYTDLIRDPKYTHDQKVLWRHHRDGIIQVIRELGLPIEIGDLR